MADSSDEEPLFPDLSGLVITDDEVKHADEYNSIEAATTRLAPLSASSLPCDASDALLGSGYCVCPNSAGR